MNKPDRPAFPSKYALTALPEIDINGIVRELLRNRTNDPIVQTSQAVELAKKLPSELPRKGVDLNQVVEQLNVLLAKYCRRTTHPGFFGYIASCGLPSDPLSYAMVAALNQNVVGYPSSPAAATIERTVVRWLCALSGLPEEADGMLLGGGSSANLTALSVATAHALGSDFRRVGIAKAAGNARPVIVCSTATHFSIQRAAAMLGIGINNVITVDTDADNRMCIDSLAKQLEADHKVLCVVASAGSTTTGAVDPLAEIADLCAKHSTWLHVDAAYGGGALLANQLRPLFRGIEHADSITIDLHKWFFTAIDSSVVLYRDPASARELFYENSDYIQFPVDGPPEQHMFFHLGPELSRRFRALPIMIALCHYGAEAIGQNVYHNVQCAKYLGELIDYHDQLELVAAPQLSIINFRFVAEQKSDKQVDLINQNIRAAVESTGQFLMSETRIGGRPVLRVCIVNHATRAEHMDRLVDLILTLGDKLSKQ
jgi:aromatic-L-amino-acid decarboxylase